jgi:5-amino-6-(5-phosphoribosylamino)uracil reductase/diaminohydroxyphosphoribosylaminopyrimidine deaminase/5-amino-6-(5-phosphoribosylamino)uracil reductase
MTLPRPSVTLHLAQTIDGRIAGRGARVALSTREGLEIAHRARAEHDAILVGAQTVVIDDPWLTVRLCDGPQPLRVVLASALHIPEGARILDRSARPQGPLLVIGAEGRATEAARARLAARGAEVCVVRAADCGWVSLPHALASLRERGIMRLLVEGGARVLTSFLRERLADRAAIEIVPRIFGESGLAAFGALGGRGGRGGVKGSGASDGMGAIDAGEGSDDPSVRAPPVALRRTTVERLGENILLRGDLEYLA